MIATTSMFPAASEPIEVGGASNVVTIRIGRASEGELVLFMPHDDEQALTLLDRLEAALDNAVSAVRLRQQHRESGALEGAGIEVEAYRG